MVIPELGAFLLDIFGQVGPALLQPKLQCPCLVLLERKLGGKYSALFLGLSNNFFRSY